MNSALVNLVEGVAQRVADNKVTATDGQAFLKRLVHGPVAAFAVKLTPNPFDDLALEFLKAVIPE
ncbi:unnamed protein product [Gemmata massiliana]|uniref:Uncharacterized protein n=1 Tax=Gemmata massiliana TaxID=1210884 RepID=A0A6P2DJ17_9BACT|nr:hypothetical protein [Gemmata massiliana]VTS01509.1 unnamed protein product [Gemmata massiliana]